MKPLNAQQSLDRRLGGSGDSSVHVQEQHSRSVNLEPSLTLGDAISLMSHAIRDPVADVAPRELIAAGGTLLAHIREQQTELARERARWAGAAERKRVARVDGAPLIEDTDAGGPRHHLRGAPVHAGEALCLLTDAGWLLGRYEWGWRPGTPPLFFFSLPGVDILVSIALPPGTLLAWPDEIRHRR